MNECRVSVLLFPSLDGFHACLLCSFLSGYLSESLPVLISNLSIVSEVLTATAFHDCTKKCKGKTTGKNVSKKHNKISTGEN